MIEKVEILDIVVGEGETRGVILFDQKGKEEDAIELIKSTFSQGLLVVMHDRDLYIDVRRVKDENGEGEILVAGRIENFNPLWASGSTNSNELWGTKTVTLPVDIETVLWPLAGSDKDFFVPDDLGDEIAEIGEEKVISAIKQTLLLIGEQEKRV